jgi:hypothetical protein
MAAEQFRMTRLQVFNWGTFDGLHDVRISEKGFLVVGRSGSGKTTLLDGISALLVPPKWIDFNAARDAARRGADRNWNVRARCLGGAEGRQFRGNREALSSQRPYLVSTGPYLQQLTGPGGYTRGASVDSWQSYAVACVVSWDSRFCQVDT